MIGFQRNPVDICIFNKFTNLDEQVTIGIHVDDQIITSQSRVNLESTITAIEEMFKETKVTKGRMHNYIGMTLDFTLKGKYKVKMQKYIEDKLKEYNVTGKSRTPWGKICLILISLLKIYLRKRQSYFIRKFKLIILSEKDYTRYTFTTTIFIN